MRFFQINCILWCHSTMSQTMMSSTCTKSYLSTVMETQKSIAAQVTQKVENLLTFETWAHLHSVTTSRNENILKKRRNNIIEQFISVFCCVFVSCYCCLTFTVIFCGRSSFPDYHGRLKHYHKPIFWLEFRICVSTYLSNNSFGSFLLTTASSSNEADDNWN